MIAENLIAPDILPLHPTDTGDEALGIMSDLYLRHLPIVDKGQLLGLVSDDQLLAADPAAPLSKYDFVAQPIFARRDDHLYDVMRLLAAHQMTVIPVLDQENTYLGLITVEKLLRFFAENGSFKDPGSIVVLEMGRHDYSLTEIARIVENEGAIILSSFLQTMPDTNRIEVTLKLSAQQIGGLLQTFERFNYEVKASFNEVELQNTLKERFDSLMNYLNV